MQLPEDPLLRELLPEFLQDWHREMPQILQAAQSHNDAELYRLGHTLKGSSLQFGLTGIAEVGIQLMECARHRRWDEVPLLCEHLAAMLQQMHHMLRSTAGQ